MSNTDSTTCAAAASSAKVVTYEELRSIFQYHARTGDFFYIVTRGKMPVGSKAGTIDKDGRVKINIRGRLYFAHRLAWLYVKGVWPQDEIDHKDGNAGNNCWTNLRDVNSTINKQNIRNAPANKKYSKLLGAHWCKQGCFWKSSIRVNRKSVALGTFDTDKEAHEAYLIAKRKMHDGCTI